MNERIEYTNRNKLTVKINNKSAQCSMRCNRQNSALNNVIFNAPFCVAFTESR